MRQETSLHRDLEDLNARTLAADPGDIGCVRSLRSCLEGILPSLEPASPSAGLLKMGLITLRVVEQNRPSQAPEILNAVAAAVAASLQHTSEASDESVATVRHAAGTLRRLLRDQDVRSSPPDEIQQTTPSDGPARPAESTEAFSSLHADPELIREFVAESCDRIAAAEAALLALETHPDDREQVNTVLRAFHTIKGASGFLGLAPIGTLSHLAENLLIRARNGEIRIVGPYADLAFQACDALKAMVKALGEVDPQGTAAAPAGLEDLLKSLAAQEIADEGTAATEEPAAPAGGPPTSERAGDGAAPTEQLPHPQSTDGAASKPGGEASVRVGTDRLDSLIDMVGELMVAHSIVAQDPHIAQEANGRLAWSVSHVGKIIRELQGLTLSLRMVPLKPTFQKVARLVRDLGRKSGKAVRLVTSGEDTEIDRNMVEALNDPLVHMVRNAIDHGIEPVEERARSGKDGGGTLTLRAYHSAGNVVIELHDDGRGLDRRKILQKGIDAGLVEAGRELADAEVHSLIFHPGLSTAEKITDVSGRGVGMDVVKRNIDSLRGKVEVASRPGEGSTFILRLPLTMAIADAMLVRVGRERYLLPTVSIEHSFRPEGTGVKTVAGRGEMVLLRGELLPVFRLHRLFGLPGAATDPAQGLLVVIEGRGRRCALLVDELVSQQQVVVKSLGKAFVNLRGIAGGAILGDGKVGLILDVGGLLELAHEKAKAA